MGNFDQCCREQCDGHCREGQYAHHFDVAFDTLFVEAITVWSTSRAGGLNVAM